MLFHLSHPKIPNLVFPIAFGWLTREPNERADQYKTHIGASELLRTELIKKGAKGLIKRFSPPSGLQIFPKILSPGVFIRSIGGTSSSRRTKE
jgi:hypothetical protein